MYLPTLSSLNLSLLFLSPCFSHSSTSGPPSLSSSFGFFSPLLFQHSFLLIFLLFSFPLCSLCLLLFFCPSYYFSFSPLFLPPCLFVFLLLLLLLPLFWLLFWEKLCDIVRSDHTKKQSVGTYMYLLWSVKSLIKVYFYPPPLPFNIH